MKQKKQKFVPLEKRSKRQQKEYYSSRRKDWNGINPVTRVMPNAKAYKRNKSGQRYEHEPLPGFLYITVFGSNKRTMRVISIFNPYNPKSFYTPGKSIYFRPYRLRG